MGGSIGEDSAPTSADDGDGGGAPPERTDAPQLHPCVGVRMPHLMNLALLFTDVTKLGAGGTVKDVAGYFLEVKVTNFMNQIKSVFLKSKRCLDDAEFSSGKCLNCSRAVKEYFDSYTDRGRRANETQDQITCFRGALQGAPVPDHIKEKYCCRSNHWSQLTTEGMMDCLAGSDAKAGMKAKHGAFRGKLSNGPKITELLRTMLTSVLAEWAVHKSMQTHALVKANPWVSALVEKVASGGIQGTHMARVMSYYANGTLEQQNACLLGIMTGWSSGQHRRDRGKQMSGGPGLDVATMQFLIVGSSEMHARFVSFVTKNLLQREVRMYTVRRHRNKSLPSGTANLQMLWLHPNRHDLDQLVQWLTQLWVAGQSNWLTYGSNEPRRCPVL